MGKDGTAETLQGVAEKTKPSGIAMIFSTRSSKSSMRASKKTPCSPRRSRKNFFLISYFSVSAVGSVVNFC